MDLTKYKKVLRELKISHQQVADHTGHSRETVTNWLLGKKPTPKMTRHLAQEIEELIEKKRTILQKQ